MFTNRAFINLLLATSCFAADNNTAAAKLTAAQVIERIQKQVGVPWSKQTVDTFKAGDPNTVVTGIVTTFAATLDVLERAAASGKNLIISHEPTFYSHLDETAGLKGDPIYEAKKAFIDQHGLVVWRFNAHWHARRPDGVMVGVTEALGWNNYRDPQNVGLFTLPATTVGELASQIKSKLGIKTMRVIGDPAMHLTRVALVPGAASASMQMKALVRDDVQVLIVGESREWETVEYARDAGTEKKEKPSSSWAMSPRRNQAWRSALDG